MKALRFVSTIALGLAASTLGWLGCSSDDNAANGLFNSPDSGGSDSTVPGLDASSHDAGGGDTSTINPACIPSTVGTPTWDPPSTYPRHACTKAAIDAYLTDCFNPTFDQTKCDTDKTTYASCLACMFDGDGGTTGPLLETSQGVTFVNYPGCLALVTDDAGPGSCAGEQGVLLACINGSCQSCPQDDGGGIGQINTCNESSSKDGGPCSSYAQAVNCGSLPQTASAVCYRQTGESFEAYASRVAVLFCAPGSGGGNGDGGTPDGSASDAGEDGGATDASDDGG